MFYNHIIETIGNTPLVKLNKVTKGVKATVLAKLETFNPGNSIKDRIGLKMVEEAEKRGDLKLGGTIIEGTSGNTGMGLALAAIAKGYRCIFTTTDKQSKEKADILKAVGAEVIVCPTNVEPEDPRSYYSVSKRLSEETPNSWYPNQYDNLDNRQTHYDTTGPEIWNQTSGRITHFVCGAGTGGTITGIGRFLKEKNSSIKVWAIDTYGSALKKYHETGILDPNEIYPYITEGIGEDIIPKNYDFTVIDHFEKVTDRDAALMAREITRKEGIFVGYSCGSAVQGLLQLKDQLTESDVVVVIFPDHGSRYVGKVYNDEWMRDRGWLQVKTVRDIVESKAGGQIVTIHQDKNVAEAVALMTANDIDQMPVMENGKMVGSLSETGLLSKLMNDHGLKGYAVKEVMEKPFPIVPAETIIEKLSTMMNKEVPAVITHDGLNNMHIITKSDIIRALSK
ncbi:MAG: pyridoxal-phosphate dependent enzyme [Chitinophagales bacterium]|jgi:cystathionine beta-synthase|nr:pyridoxal-phosphate dependent enzyme [Chitinophagales bacterium]